MSAPIAAGIFGTTWRPRVRDIASAAARSLNVTPEEFMSPTRRRRLAWARFIVWKKAHEAGRSYPEIGREFNRHHTTIMQGIRRADELKDNKRFAKIAEALL